MVSLLVVLAFSRGLPFAPPNRQLIPSFIHGKAFRYDLVSQGRSDRFWTNTATHASIALPTDCGVEIGIGGSPSSLQPLPLITGEPTFSASNKGQVDLPLRSIDDSLAVIVSYWADPNWPVLHKQVLIKNVAGNPIRLLNLVIDRIPVGHGKTEGGDRGFPLYLNSQFFLSIAHPAGFAHVEGADVVLRQYPGITLGPGQSFLSMEAVLGVAGLGGARKLFVDYVTSRMARVRLGHLKPLAILESFGGQEEGDFHNNFSVGVSESYLSHHLAEVKASREQNGVNFDYYSMEFWQDRHGNLTDFNHINFPNGFDRVRDEILDLGMKPGLWIDSGGLPDWSVDLNPATRVSRTQADGGGSFCRASEPIADIYRDGFLYQMRHNHVGLLKFDNLGYGGRPPVCDNSTHSHLPGPLYSTEAIYNSVIEFFETLRRANPNVFIMLYWGYGSPWWLQWGDTCFQSGIPIEGASPAQFPYSLPTRCRNTKTRSSPTDDQRYALAR